MMISKHKWNMTTSLITLMLGCVSTTLVAAGRDKGAPADDSSVTVRARLVTQADAVEAAATVPARSKAYEESVTNLGRKLTELIKGAENEFNNAQIRKSFGHAIPTKTLEHHQIYQDFSALSDAEKAAKIAALQNAVGTFVFSHVGTINDSILENILPLDPDTIRLFGETVRRVTASVKEKGGLTDDHWNTYIAEAMSELDPEHMVFFGEYASQLFGPLKVLDSAQHMVAVRYAGFISRFSHTDINRLRIIAENAGRFFAPDCTGEWIEGITGSLTLGTPEGFVEAFVAVAPQVFGKKMVNHGRHALINAFAEAVGKGSFRVEDIRPFAAAISHLGLEAIERALKTEFNEFHRTNVILALVQEGLTPEEITNDDNIEAIIGAARSVPYVLRMMVDGQLTLVRNDPAYVDAQSMAIEAALREVCQKIKDKRPAEAGSA